MRTIATYRLKHKTDIKAQYLGIAVPINFQIVGVISKDDEIRLVGMYEAVDMSLPTFMVREFYICESDIVPDNCNYIGTVSTDIIEHIFEKV